MVIIQARLISAAEPLYSYFCYYYREHSNYSVRVAIHNLLLNLIPQNSLNRKIRKSKIVHEILDDASVNEEFRS